MRGENSCKANAEAKVVCKVYIFSGFFGDVRNLV